VSLAQTEKNMQSINTRPPAASMVIMMIIIGAFLPGCDTENNDVGSFWIDTSCDMPGVVGEE